MKTILVHKIILKHVAGTSFEIVSLKVRFMCLFLQKSFQTIYFVIKLR